MWKATASQYIGAQMITAADGTAFTGSVTVYVTKDNGTQAAGNVGSGACTHEGNGWHSYAPDATDTNADHIAFTFIGTGAIPASIQAFTSNKFVSDILSLSANTMISGVVGSSSTTTSVITSSILKAGGGTSIGTNALAGRRVYFSGATSTVNEQNVGGRITANTSGTTPTLTIHTDDTFPTAPLSGDVFVIV